MVPRHSPDIADRDCAHCHVYLYIESGELSGTVLTRSDGRPARRPPGSRPPCYHLGADGRPKCPKSRPFGSDFYQCNREAYEYHLECSAVGDFPDDAMVRERAVVIARLDAVE